jgi:peptide/nickel transport system substrate-binding protein
VDHDAWPRTHPSPPPTPQRGAFDPNERKAVLSEIMSLLQDEVPAHFLWRHQIQWGMARNIDYKPLPDERVLASEIRVR